MKIISLRIKIISFFSILFLMSACQTENNEIIEASKNEIENYIKEVVYKK
jgi:hypothetical protein